MNKLPLSASIGTLLVLIVVIGPALAHADDYASYVTGGEFSPLVQINPANVSKLRPAWTYVTGERDKMGTARFANSSFQARPLIVEGSLVFCTQSSRVIALDPVTGKERWVADPHVDASLPQYYQNKCRGAVGVWRNPANGADAACHTRIVWQTLDARIIEVDARTGKRCGDFGTNGEIVVLDIRNIKHGDQIRFLSTPVVAGNAIVLGSAVTDNTFSDNPSGKVRAFDAASGRPLWEFDPLGARANAPALNGAKSDLGGGNVWTLIAADVERGIVYLPTGSLSIDHFGGGRPGTDDFSNSIVAVDAADGRVIWHRQLVHHDVWDYDLPAQPILADITVHGQKVPVLIQNTKMGLVFVFNRVTGEPVFGIAERPVSTKGVPGESLWPTQPMPTDMPSLAPIGLTGDQVWGMTFYDRNACRERLAHLKSEGLFTPPSIEGTIERPSFFGGAEWGGGSFDPTTGVMIVPVITVAGIVRLESKSIPPRPHTGKGPTSFLDGPIEYPAEGSPYRMSLELFVSPFGAPCSPPPWFELVALDINRQKILWRSALGTIAEHAIIPLPWHLGSPGTGGVVSTASGLTFVGASTDKRVRAFDSKSGEELWSEKVPASAESIPTTYQVGNRQYVAFAAGGHSALGDPPGEVIAAYALD